MTEMGGFSTFRSDKIQPHDVSARTGYVDLIKARRFKGGQVAHETVAGGPRFDWIRFHHARAFGARMGDRRVYQLRRDALATELTVREKARQRPNAIRILTDDFRPAQATVCRPRGDGAPRDSFILQIAQNSDRNLIANSCFYGGLALRAFCLPGLDTRRSPDHAPAGFWAPTARKQALEIVPAAFVHFVKS